MVSTATTPKFKQRQQRTDNKLLLLRRPITSFEPTLCENSIKGSGRLCLSNYLEKVCVTDMLLQTFVSLTSQKISQVFVPSVHSNLLISNSLLLPKKCG